MAGIARILNTVRDRFINTSTKSLNYANRSEWSVLNIWRVFQSVAPYLNKKDSSKGLSQVKIIQSGRLAPPPTDGDIAQLNISNPRLSPEKMFKILNNDTSVKWKE